MTSPAPIFPERERERSWGAHTQLLVNLEGLAGPPLSDLVQDEGPRGRKGFVGGLGRCGQRIVQNVTPGAELGASVAL